MSAPTAPNLAPAFSIVIPAHNEAANLPALMAEIHAAIEGVAYEIVIVDDGSSDDTVSILQSLHMQYPHMRLIRHRQSCGQSAALRSGIQAAQASVIVTMDGDGQNNPADIPQLWERFIQETAQNMHVMVMGQRQKRQDKFSKRLASHLANQIRQRILKDGVQDTGCPLKIFYQADFMALPYFDHIHRYIPALLARDGIRTITMPVRHRARQQGASHYGIWDRFKVGVVDLCGVWWLLRRRKLPEIIS